MIGVFLTAPAEGSAQDDQDSSAIIWWVVGTGGILNAGSVDGDTLSATLGQTGIDSATVDDTTYGKMLAVGFVRQRPTAWLGFWLPRTTGRDESPLVMGSSPDAFALMNRPNPFNLRTTISYVLPRDGHVRLEIFDATSRRVRLLVNESASAGQHHVEWDGRDDAGEILSSGAYFYRLEVPSGAIRTADGMMYLVR